MANYTAADIKALREQTGAGMLDVKKALDEADGDRAQAIEALRIKGLKGVTKREGRSASAGLVTAKVENGVGTLVEVNCETDFVAKNPTFIELADRIRDHAASVGAGDAETLLASELDGKTVKEVLDEANAGLGEKIEVRRMARVEGENVEAYLHKTDPDVPPQIGVLVSAAGGEGSVVRDIAMHVAAFAPTALSRDEIDPEVVENERRVAEATAKEEGKPEQALPKIIEGRVNSYFKDNVLLDQPFAKDPKKTVAKVAEESGATVTGFARLKVGV